MCQFVCCVYVNQLKVSREEKDEREGKALLKRPSNRTNKKTVTKWIFVTVTSV